MERINYPSDGLYYEGEVKDGKPEGQGIFYYVDGKPCKGGEFVDGKLQGKGWKYFENGSNYKGEFKNDLPDGVGNEYRPDGTISYSGEVAEGKRSGQGIEYYDNGNKCYVGRFLDGAYDGEGEDYQYSSETLWHRGTFRKGKFVNGDYYDDKGRLVFEGEFYPDVDGLGFKKGRFYMPDVYAVYDGSFSKTSETTLKGFTGYQEIFCDFELSADNKVMMTHCGDVYTDKPHSGRFVENGKDTDIVVNFYPVRNENGRYDKWYAYNEKDPNAFFTRFDCIAGKVQSVFKKGHLEEYFWCCSDKSHNGRVEYTGDGILEDRVILKRQGQGKLFDEEGHLIYEGEFKDGEPEGQGKQYDKDGNIVYEGRFLCGKPEEEFKRSPEYADYLKKQEEKKRSGLVERQIADKEKQDKKDTKNGCIVVAVIAVIIYLIYQFS